MNPNHSDTCNTCGKAYEFIPQDDNFRLYLVIDSPDCHFIMATCPHCGTTERMFCSTEVVMLNIQFGLKITVALVCEQLKATHDRVLTALLNQTDLNDFHNELEGLSPQDFL